MGPPITVIIDNQRHKNSWPASDGRGKKRKEKSCPQSIRGVAHRNIGTASVTVFYTELVISLVIYKDPLQYIKL